MRNRLAEAEARAAEMARNHKARIAAAARVSNDRSASSAKRKTTT